jgi:glycosyltransferase involved in cell wall biosynthesis
MRIACVQNGNFTLARRVLSAGGDETYKGQRYTVNGFLRFVKGLPHVVISLDAPPHHENSDEGEYLAVPAPAQRFWIPRRFTERARAAGIIKELARFKPTHLLLCCNDVVGCEILQWAIAHGVQSAVITASHFRRNHPPCVRFCKLASDPSVAFVANHNRAATASLLECGLHQDKAVMWDLPQFDLVPERFETKTLDPAAPLHVMVACALIPEKGVTDAVDACDLLRQRGRDVRLVICGKGPLRQRLLDHRGTKEGWLDVVGQVSHDEVLRRMQGSHLVIVPSRHSFPEAMPFVIQEALAMRTPLIVSDHPIFSQYFSDGDAMRMFAASDPAALAVAIEDLIARPQRYRELSERTAAVWASFQIDTKYHHLLETLNEKWDVALAKARAAGLTTVLHTTRAEAG